MVSKNNLVNHLKFKSDTKQRFTIKKFTVGAASVLVGTTLYVGSMVVSADEVNTITDSDSVVESVVDTDADDSDKNTSNKDEDSNLESTVSENSNEPSVVNDSNNTETVESKVATSEVVENDDTNTVNEDVSKAVATDDLGKDTSNKDGDSNLESTVSENSNEPSVVNDSNNTETVESKVATSETVEKTDFMTSENMVQSSTSDNVNTNSNEENKEFVLNFADNNVVSNEESKNESVNNTNSVLRSGEQSNILNLEDGSKISFDKTEFDGNLKDQITSVFTSSSFNAGDIYEILVPQQFVSDVSYSGLPAGLGTTSKTIEQINGENYIKITNSFINSGTVNQSFVFERAVIGFTGEELYPGQVLGSDIIVRKNGSNIGTITLDYVIPDTLQGTTNGSDTKYGADVNEPKYNNTNYDFAVSFKPLLKNTTDNSSEDVVADLNLLNRTVENIQISISVPEYFKVDTSKDAYLGGQDINLGKPQQDGVGKNVIINIPVDKISEFNLYKSGSVLEFPVVFSGMMQVPDEIVNNATTPLEFSSPEKSTIEFTFNDGSKQSLPEFYFASVRVNNLPFDNANGDSLSVKSQDSLNFVGGDYTDKVTSDLTKYGVFTGTFNVENIKDQDVSDIEFVYELPDGLELTSETIDITSTSNIELYDIVSEYWDGSIGNTLATTNNGSQLKKVSFKVKNMTPGQNIYITPGFYNIASTYHNGLSVAGGDTLITKLTVNGSEFNQVSTITAVEDKKPFINQGNSNLSGNGPFAPLGNATGVTVYWLANSNTNDYDFNLVGPTVLISVPDTLVFTKALTSSDFSVLTDNKRVSSDLYTVETIDINGNKLFKIKLDDSLVSKKSLFVSLINVPKVVADAATGSDHYYGFLISNRDYSQNNDSHGNTTFIGTDQSKMDDYQKEIVNDLINQGYNAGSIVTGTPTTFNILVSDGTTASDLTKGNLNINVSNNSTNDVFVGDEFEITHSVVNSSSTTINNLYSFVNVPGIYDGSSQFDVQLTGPIKLINVGTGDDASSNAIIVYSTNSVNVDTNNRPTLDGYVTASEVTDWSQIKSYAIVWDKFEGNQSIRAIASVKDVNSYDNVGKFVKTSSLTYADNLEAFAIKASDVASAKTTIVGSVVLHTQIKWTDDNGQEHVIKVPLDKTYDLIKNNILNKSDFLTEDSQEYNAISDQIPENYRVDFDNPTIENSNEIYRDNYSNDVAEFDQPVKYDANNDIVTYTLVPKTEEVSESKEITRTIHYVAKADPTKILASDNVQTLTFTRTGIKNLVTNEITWSDWTSDDDTFDEVISPDVDSYKSELAKVDSQTINYDSSNIEVTVPYIGQGSMQVEFIDDVTGNFIGSMNSIGFGGDEFSQETQDEYETIKDDLINNKHYQLVSTDYESVNKVFVEGEDLKFVVHLNHQQIVFEEESSRIAFWNFYYKDTGEQASEMQTDQVVYGRTVTIDLVTGQETYGDIYIINRETGEKTDVLLGNYILGEGYKLPKISGYSAYLSQYLLDVSQNKNVDPNNVDETLVEITEFPQFNLRFVNNGIFEDGDGSDDALMKIDAGYAPITIYYVKDDQKININYIDQITGQTLHSDNLVGKTDEISDYNTKGQIDKLIEQGYKLVSDETNGQNPVFDNDSNVNQVYNVYLTHDTEEVSEIKDVTRTIHYVDENGKTLADNIFQSLEFTRTGVKDKVTNEIIWGDWSSEQTFDQVDSPEIANYTFDRKLVESTNVNVNSNNIDETVVYTPNKEQVSENKIVTNTIYYVNHKGEQVFDTVNQELTFTRTGERNMVTGEIVWSSWTPEQTFDKVVSPELKGYTPNIKVIENITVGHDSNNQSTVVEYTPNVQKLTVNYIDKTTGKTLSSVVKEGFTDESSDYSTVSDISVYQKQGYNLVSDETNGLNLIFDNDDDTDQVYNVYLQHNTEAVFETKDVTRTIHYVAKADPTKTLAPDSVQIVTFTRTGTKDLVTNEITWNEWLPEQSFDPVKSPDVENYQPETANVAAQIVGYDSNNIDVTVPYVIKGSITVDFIDDETGKIVGTFSYEGFGSDSFREQGDVDFNDNLDRLVHFGPYALVESESETLQKYVDFSNTGFVENENRKLEIHLVHQKKDVEESGSRNMLWNFKYKDTDADVKESDFEQVNYFRKGVTDLVTGMTTYEPIYLLDADGNISKNELTPDYVLGSSLKLPVVPGYSTYVPQWVLDLINGVSSKDETLVKIDKFPAVNLLTANRVFNGDDNLLTVDSDNSIWGPITIYYVKDNQKINVKYIDDSTGQELHVDSLVGKSEESSGYTTADKIEELEAQGYKLVSDNTNGEPLVYDNDSSVDQNYEVHLIQDSEVVNESKVVNHTIHYVNEAGDFVFDDVEQSLTFKREGSKNKVTGELTWNDWTPEQTFDAVTSPVKVGYTADKPVVSDVSATHESRDLETYVVYSPDIQHINVTYIDDVTGAVLSVKSIDGLTGDDSGYMTAEMIKNYESQGYKFVSDSTDGKALIFDDDSNTDQEYFVHLTHATESVSDTKVVNRVIHYVDQNDNKLFDDYVDTPLEFKRTGSKDLVTGEIIWNDWDTQTKEFELVVSPTKVGYTPSVKFVSSSEVTPESSNIEETVVYVPNTQYVVVNYIDDTTGTVLTTDSLNGASEETLDYTTKSKITDYESMGYELVLDETNGNPIVLDSDDEVTQIYNVHLKHEFELLSDNKTVKRTIHYVDSDGKTLVDDYVYPVKEFIRTGVKDKVTGEITWNDWSNVDAFSAMATPVVTGYVSDFAEVESYMPKADEGDTEFTVTYTKAEQKAQITFIDDTLDKVLTTQDANGKFGDVIVFDQLDETLAGYLNAGYTLVSNDFNGQSYKADDSENNYVVHLTHGIDDVLEDKIITRTINYLDNDGNVLKDPVTQTVTLTRSGSKDKVTGEITWNDWSVGSYDAVKSPLIDGYNKPDILEVPQVDVSSDDEDSVVNVVYTAVEVPTPEQPEPEEPEIPETPQPFESEAPNVPDVEEPSVSEPDTPVNEEQKPTVDKEIVTEQPVVNTIDTTKVTPVVENKVNSPVENKTVKASELPQMGDKENAGSVIAGFSMLGLLFGLLGYKSKKKHD